MFAIYQSQLSIGSIIGAAVDYGTHHMLGKESYRIPLALFFVAPTIQTIALFWFPESPRWLMTKGREEEAEKSLRRLRNPNIAEHEFQAEWNEIRVSTREQIEQNKKVLWLEMWKGNNRRRTFLSIAVSKSASHALWHVADETLKYASTAQTAVPGSTSIP